MSYDEIRQFLKENHQHPIDASTFCELYRLFGEDIFTLYFDEYGAVSAAYSPKLGKIVTNIDKLNHIIDYYMKMFHDLYHVPIDDHFRYEMLCYVLAHEIEHMNQDAIGSQQLDPKYDFMQPAMENLYNLFWQGYDESILDKIKKHGRYIRYLKNQYAYYLERGATVEGADTVANILDGFDEEKQKAFLNFRNQYLLLGYIKSSAGSLKQTYYGLGMKKEYDKIDIPSDIPLPDKIRYGLELDKEERHKMFSLIKKKKI